MLVKMIALVIALFAFSAAIASDSRKLLTLRSEQGCSTQQQSLPQSQDSCSITCSEVSSDTCPPAFFCKQGHCECGDYQMIKCYERTSSVLTGYCVTYNDEENITTVGPYDYFQQATEKTTEDFLYWPLPDNVQELMNSTCGPYNRAGTLCGECLPNHYPLAYSYNMTYIPCPHVHWNWLKYIMATYLPLTLFYIIIVLFKINTMSSHLFAMVYFCQNLSIPAALRSLLNFLPK